MIITGTRTCGRTTIACSIGMCIVDRIGSNFHSLFSVRASRVDGVGGGQRMRRSGKGDVCTCIHVAVQVCMCVDDMVACVGAPRGVLLLAGTSVVYLVGADACRARPGFDNSTAAIYCVVSDCDERRFACFVVAGCVGSGRLFDGRTRAGGIG